MLKTAIQSLLMAAFLIVATVVSGTVSAQKNPPDFGKVDKADLEMTKCDFDPGADAIMLVDEMDVKYERGIKDLFRVRQSHRVRIKILSEKAYYRANVKLRYYSGSNWENIVGIQASVYNLDDAGNIVTTKVEKSQITKEQIDKYFSAYAFSFPGVKVGSIIEYRYERTDESFSTLPNWIFQDRIPTRFSRLTIGIPEFFKFTSQLFISLPIERSQREDQEILNVSGGSFKYGVTHYSYAMRDIPGIRDEPFMGAVKDYLQRVEFQLSQIVINDVPKDYTSNWGLLINRLLDHDNFGAQLKKNIKRTSDLDAQLVHLPKPINKMVAIYDYVRRNMEWNQEEDIYTDGVKQAWERKSGSNADINLILINLLRDAGIEAYPLLVSSRDHGKINVTYPFMQQFEKVIACAIVDDRYYILNATDKYNPATLVPFEVMGTQALLVDREKGDFITLWDSEMKDKTVVSIMGDIDKNGVLSAEVMINSFGYDRNYRVKKLKATQDLKSYIAGGNNSLKIEKLDINNLENDSLPLEQKLQFASTLNSSGDYSYFSINMFTGLEKNPFVAERRFTDVEFGCNQSYTVVGSITIEDGFEFQDLPKNMSMIMPDTSIIVNRMMQVDGNILSIRLTVDFLRPTYFANEYADFREFYKKMFAVLNEQIVVKKKG
jgi:Domain of Unknown Function with PDB structure (DUF3857)